MAVLVVALRVVQRAAGPDGASGAVVAARSSAADLDAAAEEFRGRVDDGGDR